MPEKRELFGQTSRLRRLYVVVQTMFSWALCPAPTRGYIYYAACL